MQLRGASMDSGPWLAAQHHETSPSGASARKKEGGSTGQRMLMKGGVCRAHPVHLYAGVVPLVLKQP